MAHEEEVLGKAYDARLMRRLLGYLKPHRWKVVLAIAITLLVSALGPLRPRLMQMAIDGPLKNHDVNGFTLLILVTMGSVILQAASQYFQTIITQWIGQQTIYDIRKQLFDHIQKLSLRFFDKNPLGRLVTRLTSDVEVLNELFSSGIIMIFADVFVIFWIFVFMFMSSWRLSLAVLTVFPLLLGATAIFRKKARESYREVRMLIARVNAFLSERFSGMVTVQLFGREAYTYHQFAKINRATADANIRSVFYYAVFYPAVEVLSSVSFALIIWYGGSMVLGHDLSTSNIVTIGTLVAFIQYTEQFFRPIRDLAEKYNILQSAMASSERIFRLLDDDTVLAEPVNPVKLGVARGEIEFRNVWFAYNGEDFVLKDISFHVKPGQAVAIVGATGAGKSSITNLITRMYEFQKGEILIDGIDIRTIDPQDLRRQIAIVLQDVFLFSADVETNITLGDERISSTAARHAAEIVGAAPFIERLPTGYQSQVTERGAILSVGQKQLISFARAVAFDPRILILDEATSSIDTESEQLIQLAIEKMLTGRTSIVVAHRLSTIQKADNIIVMHHGEIREQGTHNELLRQNGIYRTLYELQYKDQEEPAGVREGEVNVVSEPGSLAESLQTIVP